MKRRDIAVTPMRRSLVTGKTYRRKSHMKTAERIWKKHREDPEYHLKCCKILEDRHTGPEAKKINKRTSKTQRKKSREERLEHAERHRRVFVANWEDPVIRAKHIKGLKTYNKHPLVKRYQECLGKEAGMLVDGEIGITYEDVEREKTVGVVKVVVESDDG